MAETEAYDELPCQSGGDDGVANPDGSSHPLPQLPEPGSCRAGGPHAHDEDGGPDGPETAGGGEQVGQSGGGGVGGQTERPADGRGGSHRGPHNEDGDDKVSTTASSSSDGGIHSNNQPVGSGSNIRPGMLLSGCHGERVGYSYRIGPESDGNEPRSENYPHVQSKNNSSGQEVDSAVALGVDGEERTPSTTEASPVGSLIFQPGPTPDINGSNLGRGAHHIAGPDARQGDVEASVPANFSTGHIESELDRLGVYMAEVEAIPVHSSDMMGGDVSGGSTEPTDPESATALEGQIIVEGQRVKSTRVFGREVRSEILILLGAVLILVLAVAITVPAINSRGTKGETNGNTAQESSDVDDPSLDIYSPEEATPSARPPRPPQSFFPGDGPPLIDFGQFCGFFASCYEENVKSGADCGCSEYLDAEELRSMQCTDTAPRCLDADGPSVCASNFTAGHRVKPTGEFAHSFLEYVVDGTLISAKLKHKRGSNPDSSYCRVEIDGEECASCSWDVCPPGSGPHIGYTADCANLGYDGHASSCGSDDSAGGMFRFLYSEFMEQCSLGTLMMGGGTKGEPNGDTAQEDVDEPSLDVYSSDEGYKSLGNGDCVDSFGNRYGKVRNDAIFAGDEGGGEVETICKLFCSRFHSLPGHVGLVASRGDLKKLCACLFESGRLPPKDKIGPNASILPMRFNGTGPIVSTTFVAESLEDVYCYEYDGYESVPVMTQNLLGDVEGTPPARPPQTQQPFFPGVGPPLIDFGRFCGFFASCYEENVKFRSDCGCSEYLDAEELMSMQCTDTAPRCLDGPSVCASNFTAGHHIKPTGEFANSFLEYAFDGTLISAKFRYNIINPDSAYCRVEIDGEECASCSWDVCPPGSGPQNGYTADCANLGYDGHASSCGSDDSAGGMFRFLTSEFMKQCSIIQLVMGINRGD